MKNFTNKIKSYSPMIKFFSFLYFLESKLSSLKSQTKARFPKVRALSTDPRSSYQDGTAQPAAAPVAATAVGSAGETAMDGRSVGATNTGKLGTRDGNGGGAP
jgi:hypothetical protein